MSRPVRWLLGISVAILLADGVMTAVTQLIWGSRNPPSWEPRAWSALWLAALLSASAAAWLWLRIRKRIVPSVPALSVTREASAEQIRWVKDYIHRVYGKQDSDA